MRICRFCGKDISDKKSNATICGDPKCKCAYDKWMKIRPRMPRFCEVCGDPIDDLPGQRRICKKQSCIDEQKRRKYKTSLKEKICRKCGKTFIGTIKQTCCEDCRIHPTFTTKVTQTVVCSECGKPIDTVKKGHSAKMVLEKGLCNECKEKHQLAQVERMKIANPMFNEDVRNKVSKTTKQKYKNGELDYVKRAISESFKQRYEQYLERLKTATSKEQIVELKKEFGISQLSEIARKAISDRMKLNNPMFNQSVRKKVSDTIKTKIKNGELTYLRGVENSNWRGNRRFNKSVRLGLKDWIKKQLADANYTCQRCHKHGGELQVHHLEPLRDIISKVLENRGIDINYVNDITGTSEYFEIIDEILNYHNTHDNISIVVCPNCHNEIDSYYKRRTHENKKNN